MPSSSRRGRKPEARGDEKLRAGASTGAQDTGRDTPYFCLNCQRPGYTIDELDQAGKLAFLHALHLRRSMAWNEMILDRKKGLGSEWLPASMLPDNVPEAFVDRNRFLAFRYRDRLKMVGARLGAVFHVLWIERQYGELYDHGS